MPHFSGGGSHGGGFHVGGGGFGGGFHSSRSSSTNNGSSFDYLSFKYRVRIYRKYDRGRRTYVYYRHHRPHYIYASKDIYGYDNSLFLVSTLLIGILIFIFGIFLIIKVDKPSKLSTISYTINIVDDAHVLGNTDELMDVLKEFQNKTGITPAIYTCYNEDWKTSINIYDMLDNYGTYNPFNKYAFNKYTSNYSDETHWVFVYSVPSGEDKFDWNWKAVQGDLTDPILTEYKVEKYIEIVHTYLLKDAYYTDCEAFTNAFRDINETVMDNEFENGGLAILIVEAILICVFGLMICNYKLKVYKKDKVFYVKKSLVQYGGKPTEVTCEYCDGTFVKGMHLSCPYCGGQIKAEDALKQKKD